MSRRGLVLFIAMGVIWGIPYLLIKVAVADLGPGTLVFLRTGIGALLLVPVAAQRGALRPLLGAWRWVLLYTAVEVAIPWLLISDAETRLSSSLSGLLVACVPLIGALLALLTGADERLSPQRVAGLLIGMGGVAVLLGLDVGRGDLGAVGEIGLVTVGYAVGALLIGRLGHLPAIGVVGASLGVSALAYAPYGLSHLPASVPSARVSLSVLALGVVCTALAFLVFFALISEVGPVRAMVITYVNPAVAVALGVLLLGEPFTGGTALGFVLILAGCFVATRRGRRAPTAQPAPVRAHAQSPTLELEAACEPIGHP